MSHEHATLSGTGAPVPYVRAQAAYTDAPAACIGAQATLRRARTGDASNHVTDRLARVACGAAYAPYNAAHTARSAARVAYIHVHVTCRSAPTTLRRAQVARWHARVACGGARAAYTVNRVRRRRAQAARRPARRLCDQVHVPSGLAGGQRGLGYVVVEPAHRLRGADARSCGWIWRSRASESRRPHQTQPTLKTAAGARRSYYIVEEAARPLRPSARPPYRLTKRGMTAPGLVAILFVVWVPFVLQRLVPLSLPVWLTFGRPSA